METIKKNLQLVKNVVIGGGLGVASGYCYHKYSQVSSLGFGAGFLATQARNKVTTQVKEHLDMDQDGDVDLEDAELISEHYGINWVGGVSFLGGFGLGYGISRWIH